MDTTSFRRVGQTQAIKCPRFRGPSKLPDPDRARARQGKKTATFRSRRVQGDVALAYRGAQTSWCRPPVRVLLEEALLRPRRTQDPHPYATEAGIQGPISPHRLRHFLFTWLKDPRDRRRAHPAILRARHPPIPRDLLANRARRRPAGIRSGDGPITRVTPPRGNRFITLLVCGW